MTHSHFPRHWLIAQLDTLTSSVTSGSRGWGEHYSESGPLFLRVGNLDHDTVRIDLSDTVHVQPPIGSEGLRTRVETGDILVSITAEVGMVGLARAGLGEAYVNQHVALLRPLRAVYAEGLAYSLLDPQGLQAVAKREQYGATKPGLSLIQVRAFEVPIPPLQEQRRIVEAIESYFSRMDDVVATLERAKRNLERYRASVLKSAVEGRLIPTEAALAKQERRTYEPASILLERILAERRRRWVESGKKGKYHDPVVPDTTTLPDLPEGWCWATVDMLADLKGGVTKGQKRRNDTAVREVPYLRVANVQRGYLDLTEVKTIAATDEEIQELRLEEGDVLFNEGGDRDKLGRGWIWSGELPECIHQNHVFRARILTGDVEPRYLSWYGNSSAQAYFFDQGKQTTNLASINLTKLKRLPVPIPPHREQVRLVAEVDRLLSMTDDCISDVDREHLRCRRLRQSILKWAFEGKLTDQDVADEPASALLGRIRAERASGGPVRATGPLQIATKKQVRA